MKRLLFAACLLSTTTAFGIAELEKAVNELDAKAVESYLKNNPATVSDDDAITLASRVVSKIRSNYSGDEMRLIGSVGAGGFVGLTCAMTYMSIKQPGNIGAFLALLAAGPLVGFAVSRFLKKKPFPYDQARQIVYYLTKDVSNGKYYRADAAGLLRLPFALSLGNN